MENATDQTTTPYLLLFRNSGPTNYENLPADRRQKLLEDWNKWFAELMDSGKATEGQPLEMEIRTVSGPAGSRVTDGPFPETKEAVGGYVKLVVNSLDEATAIAQRHPAMEYGLEIEIRQLIGSCDLGVASRSS